MARPDEPHTPDQWLNGPIAEDERDGRGLGPTLGMDVSVEHERDELERGIPEGGPTNLEAAAGAGRSEAGVQTQAPGEAGALDSSTYGGAGAELRRETTPAQPDLNDSVLKSPGAGGAGHDFGTGPTAGDVGGANAAGFGASLGQKDDAPPFFKPPGGDQPLSDNEQQDSRKSHGLAQGGAGPSETAPDQTRAQGTLGSINDTEGL
jgi:hypothetical protein